MSDPLVSWQHRKLAKQRAVRWGFDDTRITSKEFGRLLAQRASDKIGTRLIPSTTHAIAQDVETQLVRIIPKYVELEASAPFWFWLEALEASNEK